MNEKLKPCPFCGNTKSIFCARESETRKIEYGKPNFFTICCDFNNGGCGAASGYRRTKEEAIEAWNRRSDNGKM